MTSLVTCGHVVFDSVYMDTPWYCFFFEGVSCVARFALLGILWQSDRDERCFILKMMTKIVVLYVLLASPMVFVWEWRASETRRFTSYICCGLLQKNLGLLGAQSADTETDIKLHGQLAGHGCKKLTCMRVCIYRHTEAYGHARR